jgi:hypothetical protein
MSKSGCERMVGKMYASFHVGVGVAEQVVVLTGVSNSYPG